MRLSVFVNALAAVLLFGVTGSAGALEDSLPFPPGEKICFSARWNFIPAGTGSLEIRSLTELNGEPARHFVFTARTNSFVDLIYKVRDRYDSYTDLGMTHSLLYKRRNEGREKRDIVVQFDWERQEVCYSNFGKTEEPVPVLAGSFDPLSVYYAFRLHDFGVGDVVRFPVTDGKKSVEGIARVTARETIEVDGIHYDTYKIEPSLEHFGGVFKKSPEKKLEIWVTADQLKIPVRMEVEVIIGSVVFERTHNGEYWRKRDATENPGC
ncbi:MAG: DUF3108 domain-containing protein [Deltaproteobacteria bacterium]|nr:DUF3108 domain-containing protein [Deltaproteobacteria bacterium]